MRQHLALKQVAASLGIRETYAGQALDPAVNKLARLWLDWPEETLLILIDRAREIREDRRRESARRDQEIIEQQIRTKTGGRGIVVR